MNSDVFIIESKYFGETTMRNVFAADQADARATHELHYPADLIVTVRSLQEVEQ